MSSAITNTRGASPFSKGAVLAVVLVSFTAFLAMIYFISIGDTGGREGRGAAHASANGLNGFSGLAQLLESEGFEVERSRAMSGLDTSNLLILTPSRLTDPQELSAVLQNRQYLGPTMVILPKWYVSEIEGEVVEEDRDKVRRDWVALSGVNRPDWTDELPEPFRVTTEVEGFAGGQSASWRGQGFSGKLPTQNMLYAEADSAHQPLITDSAGRVLALSVIGNPGTDYYDNAHWTTFVVEPDLVNNFGLADPNRAGAAIALVREAGYGDGTTVTFDMTMHGIGNQSNLLTLAFQPPFLAATLCLILAILIVGWRAFLRFGPAAASKPDIAFGKSRLVSNGAGLIVRARRLGLLGAPYIALMERRLGRALGLSRPDANAIDQAIARRLPKEEPFSNRASRLENAEKPSEILRAAQALNDLTEKLSGKSAK